MGCVSSIGRVIPSKASTRQPEPSTPEISDETSQQNVKSESSGPANVEPFVVRAGGAQSGGTPAGIDGRSLVLIIWDIENVRLPLNTASGLSPQNVVGYLKRHFIYNHGRTEYRTISAVTERSLPRIQRNHPTFVKEVVPDLTLLLATADHAKRDADVVLKKELHRFTTEHAHIARANPGQLTIGLVTGDEDFLEPVQAALQAGFAVELLSHDNASRALLAQGYRNPPGLWSDFLRKYSGVKDVVLPYGDEQMNRLICAHSLLVASLPAGGKGMWRGPGGPVGGEATVTAVRNMLAAAATSADNPHVVLVEPSYGDFSGSCCVAVTWPEAPRGADVVAVAQALRRQAAAAAGGAGPHQGPRLAVFDARQILRLHLETDENWVPGADGDADKTMHGTDEALSYAGRGPEGRAAGRGVHDRLAESCFLVSDKLRNRHPADAAAATSGSTAPWGGQAHAQRNNNPWNPQQQWPPYQQHPQHQQHAARFQLLCRFYYVPGPGRLGCTLLCGGDGASKADVQGVLSYLRALDSELVRQHGVRVRAEAVMGPEAEGRWRP